MDYSEKEERTALKSEIPPDDKPIEPREGGFRIGWIKGVLFLVFSAYLLVSAFHAPLLTALGRYLIVQHEPEKSDLIVCLAGGNVDRGLETADAYQKGLAPKVFMAREELPDGYDKLVKKGIPFPTTTDLFADLMNDLGIPKSALIFSDDVVASTWEEAQQVEKTVDLHGFKSIIIITSPPHTKRSWLTYKKVFGKDQIRIFIVPSQYSDFRPEDWWKRRRYVRDVIFEYQKLILYFFKYFL